MLTARLLLVERCRGGSETESEFEADLEDLVSAESSAEESVYDGPDASDASGSGSYDDVSDKGDDSGELERKATKCTYLCVLARHGLVLTGWCFLRFSGFEAGGCCRRAGRV